jgi:hypothetical protein
LGQKQTAPKDGTRKGYQASSGTTGLGSIAATGAIKRTTGRAARKAQIRAATSRAERTALLDTLNETDRAIERLQQTLKAKKGNDRT